MTEARRAFGGSGGSGVSSGTGGRRGGGLAMLVAVVGLALSWPAGAVAAMMLPVQGAQPKDAEGGNRPMNPPAVPAPSGDLGSEGETPGEPLQGPRGQRPSGPGCQDQGSDLDLIV